MTNVSCLVLKYAFLDARFFNAFAIFHAFDTPNLATFPLLGVGFSVFKQALRTKNMEPEGLIHAGPKHMMLHTILAPAQVYDS